MSLSECDCNACAEAIVIESKECVGSQKTAWTVNGAKLKEIQ